MHRANYCPEATEAAIAFGLHPSRQSGRWHCSQKWSPPAGMEIKSFCARADGKGGSVVVETDDVKALFDPPSFGAINNFEIISGSAHTRSVS